MSIDDGPTAARSTLGLRFSLLALFIFVTLMAVALAWLVQPNRVEIVSLFRVSKNPQKILDSGEPSLTNDADYETIKKTQIASIKAYFVLNAALRKSGIATLSVLQPQQNPIEWLEDHLEVDFPDDSEYLQIKLVGPEAYSADYVKIVDAVSKAYMDEVLFKETARRLGERDQLNRSLKSLQEKISEQLQQYAAIAQGIADAGANDAMRELTKSRLDRVDAEIMRLEDEQAKLEGNGEEKQGYFERRISELRETQAELEKQLMKRTPESAELAALAREVQVLQRIADEMNAQAIRMEIDSQSPQQIEYVQPAVASPVD